MTQPEETTAALIARLHEQNRIANMELARLTHIGAQEAAERERLKCQRDQSFAATSKAQDERDQAMADLEASKAECLQWRKDIDEERRQVAFRDSMIANMTKQMDESDRDRVRVCNEQRARAEKAECALEAEVERCIAEKRQGDIYWNKIHEARKKLGETKPEREGGRSLALCVLDIKGLVDALDQDNRELRQRAESAEHKVAMLEAEVASLRQSRDEADETLIRERKHLQELAERCPRKLHCRSIDIIRDRLETFAEQEAGRNKEAAKLRKELEEAREQLAVMTKQWEGCKCARLSEREPLSAMRTATLQDLVNSGAIGKSALLYICGFDPPQPARPEPRFKVGEKVYGSGSVHEVAFTEWHSSTSEPLGWWMYTTATKWLFRENELKPAPKFNIGDMVCFGQTVSWRVMHRNWTAVGGDPGWYYCDPCGIWFRESAIKPAPKFAVGEWATHKIWGDVEVFKREWEVRPIEKPDGMWVYSFATLPSIRTWETDLTAQTPQHKHDCKGCVFLGRMGEADLYWCSGPCDGHAAATIAVLFPGGSQSVARMEVPVRNLDRNHIEARRRAVARGLVKP